jgi:DtxR family Mn-dependent transcriptional regulator
MDGSVSTVLEQRLLDLVPGQTAIVGRVSDQDPERLRYLQRLGITPGTRITLLETLPFDGPLRVEIAGIEHAIGRSLAATVQVAA